MQYSVKIQRSLYLCRNTMEVADSTIIKKRKLLFVNGSVKKRAQVLMDRNFKSFRCASEDYAEKQRYFIGANNVHLALIFTAYWTLLIEHRCWKHYTQIADDCIRLSLLPFPLPCALCCTSSLQNPNISQRCFVTDLAYHVSRGNPDTGSFWVWRDTSHVDGGLKPLVFSDR